MRHEERQIPEWARTPIRKEGGLISPYESSAIVDEKTFKKWEAAYSKEQRKLRGEYD